MRGATAGVRAAALSAALALAACREAPLEPGRVESPERVARHEVAELVFHAGRVYDSSRPGGENPFDDVTLRARVRAPDGRAFEADGFFDGDPLGGLAGDVFRLRIAVDEPGHWSWQTESNLASLDGLIGGFECAGVRQGRFAAGPVVVDSAHPRRFKLRDGGPLLLLGKFLDDSAPGRIGFSHTLLSEKLSDGEREAMLAWQLGQRVNKLNVYLANVGDYGGLATTPWLGSAGASDRARFDLARWRRYEAWVERLADAGLVAHLWFFADDSDFGDLTDAERQRLLRYGMARLSAYVNTMFVLALEWQEGWSRDEVGEDARFLQRHNPWRRLVSVHGRPGDFAFPNADWADYLELQTGFKRSPEEVHALTLRNRALARRPLIAEEFTHGAETDEDRVKTWAAFMAAPAGLGTGVGLPALAGLAATLPLERLEPADELVVAGAAWALAEPGRHYLAYLRAGESLELDLRGAAGPLRARWFDPRTGGMSEAGSVDGGAARRFRAPGEGDWALWLDAP